MQRVMNSFAGIARYLRDSPTLRSLLGQLLHAGHQFSHWYVRNWRQTVPGTLGFLFGLWLARLFDNGTTESMFSALGLPTFLFFRLPVALACAFIAAGYFSGNTGHRNQGGQKQ